MSFTPRLISSFVVACLFLNGCETTVYKDQDGNEILSPQKTCPDSAKAWTSLGFKDGYCGKRRDIIDQKLLSTRYSLACTAKGQEVNYAAYLAGASEGRSYYCTPSGAHWLGRAGKSFRSSRCQVGTAIDSWKLNEAYHDGREARGMEEEVRYIYLSAHGRVVNSGGMYGTWHPPLQKDDQKRVDKLVSRFSRLDDYEEAQASCEYWRSAR